MNYDAVLSYHLNPLTCGVARFNQQLAQRLGVPLKGFHPFSETNRYPLVSLKAGEISEFGGQNTIGFHASDGYVLLLHDRLLPRNHRLYQGAARVFYADEIGCPSTLQGNPTRGTLNVLLFGMSHKIDKRAVHIDRLRDLLIRSGTDYTVSVSTAVHEGTPWDGAFTKTVDNLRKVFGDKLRVLGYLADDALARELRTCQAVALFFDPAARANNTTLWGALEAGTPVITNLDAYSPPELIHNRTVFDLARMTAWPVGQLLAEVALGGQRAAAGRSWDALIEILHA